MYVTAAEGYDKNPPCDICEVGNKAIERCLDCEENMCTGCLTFHHKMKATRAHRTSPIGKSWIKLLNQHSRFSKYTFSGICGKSTLNTAKAIQLKKKFAGKWVLNYTPVNVSR